MIEKQLISNLLSALEHHTEQTRPIEFSRAAVQAAHEYLQKPEQEPVSDRENSIIRFALHQFMSNAYHHLNAAAQDKDYRRYSHDAAEKFAKDAKDAEALLGRLQFTAPPQRTWVGLTKEEIEDIEITWEATSEWSTFGHAARYIEAKLKEKNT